MSFEKYIKNWDVDLYEQTETQLDDVVLLQKLIGGQKALDIFEVACGTGRIFLPLVQDGHRLTGMDRDNNMLARLFAKAEDKTGFTIIQGDATEACWGTGYDLAVLAGNILLNIVSTCDPLAAEQMFVQKAFAALIPGGHLFMDNNGFQNPGMLFTHPGIRVIFDGTDSVGVYGRYMLIDSVYDAATQSVSGMRRWELTAEGQTYTKEESYRKVVPTIAQMERWMREAGFLIERSFGDYEGNPIGENTWRAIYWARKPE